ncbi:MAG: hypothetical protein KME16_16500 [Scytolyngbya sp. HA4215-MV1]|nr:hypothetical protein [Scytolyngbya sp. HA4215-MV1]
MYQQIVKQLQGTAKQQQRSVAQLAWIKYRDATCAFERWDGRSGADYSDNSGYVLGMLLVFLKALLSKAFKNTNNTFEALPIFCRARTTQ